MNHKINLLPNLFILGAAKSGTTTLFHLLDQHPEIFMSFEKEPMFFSRDDYYAKGLKWYINTYFSNSHNFSVRGEASPHYLYWAKKVSKRIRQISQYNTIKFLIILRNPVERAYSHYWNMVADGREDLPFYEALILEEKRISESFDELESYGSMQYGYFRGGCYEEQIQHYLEKFPAENFMFMLQDDIINNQRATMKDVFKFLNINPDIEVETTKSNPASIPKNKTLQKILKNRANWKEIFKKLIPLESRYKIKNFLLEVNTKVSDYPVLETEERSLLKNKYSSQLEKLSLTLNRDVTYWTKR